MGRNHSVKEYTTAMLMLHSIGFDNINTDLIIGVPKQTPENVFQSLNIALKNNSTHISCYSLILEEETKLFKTTLETLIRIFPIETGIPIAKTGPKM